MKHLLSCIAPRDKASSSSPCGRLSAATSSQASFLDTLFAEAPTILIVIELDCLDGSAISESATLAAPLYQTKLASDYFDQALDLQGDQVTSRQILAHLLDQHPNGLIPALAEIHEAISNGKQWKHVCQVKVPAAMKASSSSLLPSPLPPATPSISTPIPAPLQHQSLDSHVNTSAFFSQRATVTSSGLNTSIERALSTNLATSATPSRTMSFLQAIRSSSNIADQQMPTMESLDKEAVDVIAGDSSESLIGVDLLQEPGLLPIHSGAPLILGSPLENVQEEEETNHAFLWHEVVAKPLVDPTSGKKLVLVLQHELTVHMDQLSQLSHEIGLTSLCGAFSEQQMACLSSTFPRHILEHLIDPMRLDQLASASNIMMSTFDSQLVDLPSEVDLTVRFPGLSNMPEQKQLARIPTEGFEKLARSHQGVTILFMDIVGFTSMCKQVPPATVMAFLNKLFSLFDRLSDKYGVQKIETAGDSYVAAVGILEPDGEGFSVIKENGDATKNATRMMQFAKAMLIVSKRVKMPHDGQPVMIRIGLHSGDCVTGLVGSKLPKFSVFGDTMNTASRMESTCTPGHVAGLESSMNSYKTSTKQLFFQYW